VSCPVCEACDTSAGCIAKPRADCRRPAKAKGATLALTNRSQDRKDALRFAWTKGAATTLAELGDPVGATDYTLCVFDRTGGADRLVLRAAAPHGASWKPKGAKGFRYRSRGGAPDGLTSLVLKSGGDRKARATLAGRGASLGLPALALGTPVTAELDAGDGACFAAEFAAPSKNTATTFRAKGQ